MSDPAFSDDIDGFLRGHHVMSLATSDGNVPWAASVFYVFDPDGKRLLYFSSIETRHGREARRNDRVAATIASQERDISKLAGLQIAGRTKVLNAADTEEGRAILLSAFPEIANTEAPIWALLPEAIKMVNNAKGFGNKHLWPSSS